jgi:hypothetical protein
MSRWSWRFQRPVWSETRQPNASESYPVRILDRHRFSTHVYGVGRCHEIDHGLILENISLPKNHHHLPITFENIAIASLNNQRTNHLITKQVSWSGNVFGRYKFRISVRAKFSRFFHRFPDFFLTLETGLTCSQFVVLTDHIRSQTTSAVESASLNTWRNNKEIDKEVNSSGNQIEYWAQASSFPADVSP